MPQFLRDLANAIFNQTYALVRGDLTLGRLDFAFFVGNTEPGTVGFKAEAYYHDWNRQDGVLDEGRSPDRMLEFSLLIGPITVSLSIWLDGQMG